MNESVSGQRRRLLGLAALLCLCPLGACARMGGDKPVLRLSIGATSKQVDAQSTLKVRTGGYLGRGVEGRFVTSPHALVYADMRLQLTLTDCGAEMSMPTVISLRDDRVTICTASVLGEYVPVDAAVARIKTLLADIQSQGFEFDNDEYARFAELTSYPAQGVKVPQSLASVDDVAPFFLNADYCAAEMIAFILVKQGLQVQVRLKNMRRAFPRGHKLSATIRSDEMKLSDQQRRTERVYYLELSIAEHVPKNAA